MLKKKYRLTSSNDFDKIYRKGKKFRGELGMLIVLKSDENSEEPKFGFVVGKKIGNAVDRNKHKRWLREIVKEFLKENEDINLSGVKFSYISFKPSKNYGFLKEELTIQLEDAKKFISGKNK